MDGSIIDQSVFGQVLEMDDDGNREFSKNLVDSFHSQSKETFQNLRRAMYVVPSRCVLV
jgi:osomolarity two-component system phosphorelay intermediate protein YPD1